MHQLTDLPDAYAELSTHADANERIRIEGTRNLIAAAEAAGAHRFVAQSIAWRPRGRGDVIDRFEQLVLNYGGVVARYGQFYGAGTYYEQKPPEPPRIHIDDAARATLPLLDAPSGVVTIVEPG